MDQINRWEWWNEGVVLYPDRLMWYEKEGAVRFASGGACDQSLDDFLKHGPPVDRVPDDILCEVTAAVHAHLAKGDSA